MKIYVGRPSKYNVEFRSDAVALWRASEGRRTFKDIAADLNVNPETLRDAENGGSQAGRPGPESVQAELARLRAECGFPTKRSTSRCTFRVAEA